MPAFLDFALKKDVCCKIAAVCEVVVFMKANLTKSFCVLLLLLLSLLCRFKNSIIC